MCKIFIAAMVLIGFVGCSDNLVGSRSEGKVVTTASNTGNQIVLTGEIVNSGKTVYRQIPEPVNHEHFSLGEAKSIYLDTIYTQLDSGFSLRVYTTPKNGGSNYDIYVSDTVKSKMKQTISLNRNTNIKLADVRIMIDVCNNTETDKILSVGSKWRVVYSLK
jgi:hypothetical protein